ncbi:MAG: hypothetical protein IK079_03010, partial [Desulfovibrio sp.]|nr:hypothetical protein [Desulfovibrio sp.]
ENEEFTVRDASQELGTIVYPPPIGDKLAIAGHVWVVLDVDYKRHVILCEKVKGKVSAYFGQCPGDLHTKILCRMHKVLQEENIYPYLSSQAKTRLTEARECAHITKIADQILIPLGENTWCLFPWLGTYAFMTLERFIKLRCSKQLGINAFESAKPFFMQFTMNVDAETFFATLLEEIQKPLHPFDLLHEQEVPQFEKYDRYLPPELAKKGFAFSILNIQEMKTQILSWKLYQKAP